MRSDSTITDCHGLTEDLGAGDDAVLSGPARAHVAECLRCQAELANFRRLRRSMRALASAPALVDVTLEHEILVALDDADGRSARRVPGYAAAAAAVGGLAAAAGVIALATRGRRNTRLAV
ncbi:MAG: hypothetical protein P8J50_16085 [Acidimicrobiales bacterium]|jgi:anti-sigma factor RsiW|nr:hypothetical protein [Acidimicrobiales bacterium]